MSSLTRLVSLIVRVRFAVQMAAMGSVDTVLTRLCVMLKDSASRFVSPSAMVKIVAQMVVEAIAALVMMDWSAGKTAYVTKPHVYLIVGATRVVQMVVEVIAGFVQHPRSAVILRGVRACVVPWVPAEQWTNKGSARGMSL